MAGLLSFRLDGWRARALAALAAILACAGPAAAAVDCGSTLNLTPTSDLDLGRLIVADRGGGVDFPASSCSFAGTDGVMQLVGISNSCATFEINGGAANANRLVQLQVQAPRSFSYASGGGLIEVVQVSVAGTNVLGAGQFYVVRLDGAGRGELRMGTRLRIVRFAPGTIAAPINLIATYLGCPA
jgi:hypothetical protein